MGVYIKGLNKKDISDLRVHKHGGAYEFVEYEDIIEVKTPHGRLIDGDRFYEEFEPNSWSEGMAVSTYIKKAPTVIEAEVE